MYANIDTIEQFYVTREASGSGDGDETHTDHTICGFTINKKHGDLPIGFKPQQDRDYYLLYALYTTGDSFGSDSGKIEYVGLYSDRDVAMENKKRIYSVYNDDPKAIKAWSNKEKTPIQLYSEFGTAHMFGVPWNGYFEHLDSVQVETIRLLVDNYMINA